MSHEQTVEELIASAASPNEPEVLEERAQLLSLMIIDAILVHIPRNVPSDQFNLIVAAVTARLIKAMARPGMKEPLAAAICQHIRKLVAE